MATIIEFKSRKTLRSEEPVEDGQLDWRFEHKSHPRAGRMVEITILARADSVEEIRSGYLSAWSRMIMRECKSA